MEDKSKAGQRGTMVVRKTDNGFNGVATNESARGLWEVGKRYSTGS